MRRVGLERSDAPGGRGGGAGGGAHPRQGDALSLEGPSSGSGGALSLEAPPGFQAARELLSGLQQELRPELAAKLACLDGARKMIAQHTQDPEDYIGAGNGIVGDFPRSAGSFYGRAIARLAAHGGRCTDALCLAVLVWMPGARRIKTKSSGGGAVPGRALRLRVLLAGGLAGSGGVRCLPGLSGTALRRGQSGPPACGRVHGRTRRRRSHLQHAAPGRQPGAPRRRRALAAAGCGLLHQAPCMVPRPRRVPACTAARIQGLPPWRVRHPRKGGLPAADGHDVGFTRRRLRPVGGNHRRPLRALPQARRRVHSPAGAPWRQRPTQHGLTQRLPVRGVVYPESCGDSCPAPILAVQYWPCGQLSRNERAPAAHQPLRQCP